MIGFVRSTSSADSAHLVAAFRQGLKEAGFVEGQNCAIEYRWADNQFDRLPALVADLIQRKAAVILTGATPVTRAAKAATTTVPIVFVIGADPIKVGLVASLNRPGGNVTGVSFLANSLLGKQFEVLHETVPKAASIGFLVNPINPNAAADTRDVQAAADALGRKLSVVQARTDSDFETAFATLVQNGVGALCVDIDPFFITRPRQLVALAARHALPAIYPLREFATAGGLMSYGTNLADAYRQAGVYAGRILKGAKPADLPVVQSSRFELLINVGTAHMLGLTVPASLLA
ncbi:MAG: ABC transporter substrate-binding protein, partial [Sphingomicrobium sp.]